MKNSLQQTTNNKQQFLFKICMLFLFLFSNLLFSQTGNLAIQWDQEVGCQSYDYDHPLKIFLSNIEDGQCINVCEYSTINYQLLGDTNTITNVSWIVAGGSVETAGGLSNSVNWTQHGFGNIQLNITFTNGTTITKNLCVEKIIIPVSMFTVLGQETATLPLVCQDQEVNFINTSSTNNGEEIVTSVWDFGDGTTSEVANPIHVFSQIGTHTISLTTTNRCGCSDVYILDIFVKKTGVTITCANVACENEKSIYSIDPTDLGSCTTGIWNVVGGQFTVSPDNLNIEVIWNSVPANGFGYVYFDNSTCNSTTQCGTVNVIAIPIIKTIGEIEGNSSPCASQQYRYKLPQWPTTIFIWHLEDNGTGAELIVSDQRNEVIITMGTAGNILLTCHYTNTLLRCGGTATFLIKVKGSMVISGPTKLCQGDDANFTLTDTMQDTLTTGNWTLSGPDVIDQTGTGETFTGVFLNAGTYVLNAESESYCNPNLFTIVVNPKPIKPTGITGPVLVCPSTPYIYTVLNPLPGFVYGWTVTNGNIIGSNYGESITVRFNNNTVPNPDYTVSVRAYSNSTPYCQSKAFILNVNKIVPIFNIAGDTTVCASATVNYSTAYIGAEDYIWEIVPARAGSITQGNGTNAVSVTWNNYSDAPPVFLRLRVRKCNELYMAQKQINIIFSPTINLTANNTTVCRGANFTVTINSDIPITQIDHIDWNFGDGFFFTTFGMNILSYTHQYFDISTSDTQYTVTAVVYGANGCIYPTTDNIDITVIPAPVATLTPGATIFACEATDINIPFFVNIEEGFGATTNIVWYHNGNIIPNAPTGANATTYTPTAFGDYYAIVYNANGCSTETNVNTVLLQCGNSSCEGAPIMSPLIVTQTSCDTYAVALTTPISPAPYQYFWQGSDGITISSPIVSSCNLTINQPGNYYIGYRAGYLLPNQTVCESNVVENFFVPYMADIKYTIGCNTNNTYDVTLLNHSTVASGFTIANYEFTINDGTTWVDMDTTQNYIVPNGLAPGTYQVGIRITTPNHAPCTKIIELILPAFPIATFTPNALTTCPDTQIQFVPTDTTVGNIYFWQFGDGSTNYQQSPIKTYDNQTSNIIENQVSLTVTNPLGCSATYFYPNIEAIVHGANMTGTIQMTPINGIACQGGLITLTYALNTGDQSDQTPTSYEWHKEGNASFIVTTILPFYNPTTSGTYWLVVYNANGCKRIINGGKIVSFIPVPTPVIKGPTSACADNPFTLDGYVGGNVQYQWKLNSVVIATTPSITQTLTTPGVYTYKLQLTLNGCVSTVATHTITLLEQPLPPSIDIIYVDCSNYTIKLLATATEPGFFTWSNGSNGDTTLINSGGPYQVRFTNMAGCSSTAQIMIPHSPSYYLWVFPRGCYKFCKKETSDLGGLIGPLETMTEWQWLINNTIVNSDIDSDVLPIQVVNSGDYQLVINTGLCMTQAAPISIQSFNCPNCPITLGATEAIPQLDGNNNLYYNVTLTITSVTNLYASILNAPNIGGTFIPNGLTLLSGTHNYAFIYQPPANFTSDTLHFYFDSETNQGPCLSPFQVTFPPYIDDKTIIISQQIANSIAYLYAVPNPSKDTTLLYFNSGILEDNLNYTLVIYDTTGRVLLEKSCSSKGAIPLNCSILPVGMYSILMKNGDTIVNKTKFIKN